MKFLTITGWGQKQDSLQFLVPKNSEHLNYIKYNNYQELSDSIKKPIKTDMVIGWSLGTQIAMRLIAEGKLEAKCLILMAPPYQFVSNMDINSGTNHITFMVFKNAFHFMPHQTLQKFTYMIAFNDSHLKQIADSITVDESNHANWEGWLDEIGKFSCSSLDFSEFPRTVIIHGNVDTVVDVRQVEHFVEKIKDLRVEIIDKSSHAPHLHSKETIQKIIEEECHLIKA